MPDYRAGLCNRRAVSILAALGELGGTDAPQQLGRLDLKDRGGLGDDIQPRIARGLLQLARVGAVDAHRGLQ
jgi:hypothetical protein